MKTVSDIIRNNTEPDIEDSRMLCYTENEVRNMIFEASSLAYQYAMQQNNNFNYSKSLSEYLEEMSWEYIPADCGNEFRNDCLNKYCKKCEHYIPAKKYKLGDSPKERGKKLNNKELLSNDQSNK